MFSVAFNGDRQVGSGLVVVGGASTPLKGIFVVAVLPNSPAAREGHISVGDRVLEVNGRSTLLTDIEEVMVELSRTLVALVVQHVGLRQWQNLCDATGVIVTPPSKVISPHI